MAKIGCCALVIKKGEILTIRCAKGRGFILPGGKWEEGETFSDTAIRELEEETGLVGWVVGPVYSGINTDGYYVKVYLVRVEDYSTMAETPEGVPQFVSWRKLKESTMWPLYEDMLISLYDNSPHSSYHGTGFIYDFVTEYRNERNNESTRNL